MADKCMRTGVVVSLFLVMALFSGCGSDGISLTDADNGEQVTLQSDETLRVILQSNPTTGYGWQVTEIDDAVLKQVGEPEFRQESGAEGLVGAGGMETFQFKAIGKGETNLVLGYMRSWEDVPPTEVFLLQVVVE